MTEEQIDLARRAVACPKWRWMPGMQTNSKFARVVEVDSTTGVPCAAEQGATNDDCHAVWLDDVPLLPDLTDPATLGCVLALVREAWDDECLCILPVDYGPGGVRWACRLTATGTFCTGQFWPTEIGALVDALEKDCLDLEDLVDGE